MSSDELIADVTDSLRQRGFDFKGRSNDGWFVYRGTLDGGSKIFACELQVAPNFSEYPRVRLLERPLGLPLVVPHLGADCDICYIARGTVVLDIFDPAGQTLACLDRATDVFQGILAGKFCDDLEDEFYAYWTGIICFVDLRDARLGQQILKAVKNGPNTYPVVTDDLPRTQSKLKQLGWTTVDCAAVTYRVKTTTKPRPHNMRWPIENVQQLLEWQGLLDKRCRKKLQERIQQARATKALSAIFIIESPLMTYGAWVDLGNESPSQRGARQKKIAPLFSLPVIPLEVIRLDEQYMAERNQPGRKTLAGKRLVLVGCGTIGGYLADLLLKVGAGTGGGSLEMVDFDDLKAQNLGRHRLGVSGLFNNKAVALKRELDAFSPGANIAATPRDVREIELGAFDLLIDATGEESLGHWLARKYRHAALLTVWIEGPGVAVRGVIRANEKGGCFRCLCDANRAGLLQAVEGEMPKLLAGQGCEGLYVPFPATVSLQAAALGAEMVSSWVNNDDAPTLRTRVLDSRFQNATPDCNLLKHSGCPACSS
ncbi:ThiF family adenylyltransferase [Propionivibrio dicarboxylicus]|uniref:Molybdopterin or thiamine biosynthesis adenylyltransferase n=1 Tax=Propionivibrio dicarboxylicus TaxID=83767 RepID=A0A1G8EKU1_9RHOO|nr:ThiF family adenylyltransferase [Propionivibrio dicarboxylicus]SDH70477.1 Molybdopterin or thiamine biosynthesis adenylyltransferase [Propionivibrio dicarboxylicus]